MTNIIPLYPSIAVYATCRVKTGL